MLIKNHSHYELIDRLERFYHFLSLEDIFTFHDIIISTNI